MEKQTTLLSEMCCVICFLFSKPWFACHVSVIRVIPPKNLAFSVIYGHLRENWNSGLRDPEHKHLWWLKCLYLLPSQPGDSFSESARQDRRPENCLHHCHEEKCFSVQAPSFFISLKRSFQKNFSQKIALSYGNLARRKVSQGSQVSPPPDTAHWNSFFCSCIQFPFSPLRVTL